MRLRYIGDVAAGEWLPGEPADDHWEPDEAKAEQKLQSGFYRNAGGRPPRDDGTMPVEDDGHEDQVPAAPEHSPEGGC